MGVFGEVGDLVGGCGARLSVPGLSLHLVPSYLVDLGPPGRMMACSIPSQHKEGPWLPALVGVLGSETPVGHRQMGSSASVFFTHPLFIMERGR